MKKIAIVGTATSSRLFTPVNDPTWEVWCCSPANDGIIKRVDAWFELHVIDELMREAQYSQYLLNIQNHPKVYVQKKYVDLYENAEAYPKDEMVKAFGPWFFTSSIAWMMALAISKKPEEIGVWGVDMATDGEYLHQRPGCQFFIREADLRGIKITVPEESDLMRPPPLYGYSFTDPLYVRMKARKDDVDGRIAAKKAEVEAANRELFFLEGAVQDMNYVLKTWT